jgi:hypothetical protein
LRLEPREGEAPLDDAEGSAGRTEGQIAKLIQDYEIVANQPFGDLTCFALRFFFSSALTSSTVEKKRTFLR